MRRISAFTLAVLMLAVSVGYTGEGGIAYTRGQDARIKTKVYAYSASYLNGQDASGTLVAGTNRILGFTLSGSSASTGGLYDTTSTTNVSLGTGVIAETNCAAGYATTLFFPTPLEWSSTLYAFLPTSGSSMIIYYE